MLGAGEHVSHTTMSEWADFTVSPAAVSGRLAFERAGLTPADIDVCELYDAFTYMVLVTLEDLGFCAKGDGGAFVEDGRLQRGRRAPDEHRWRRAVGVPSRACAACSCWSRPRGSCGARPVRARSTVPAPRA